MKKNYKCFLIAVAILFSCHVSRAQVLFSENFDNIPGSTAGGPGTYAFPSGWLLRNVDNKKPDTLVYYVKGAWERREDFAGNVSDSAAFSTSYYSPTGAADDWMWTPLIGPLTSLSMLSWKGLVYDGDFADGYEVRVMISTDGPPTGGTGAIGNQVTNSTVVFSTPAEDTVWTTHSASLAAYAGQSVYVAFRNNSNDKFLLLIDDVVVENIAQYDAAIMQTDTVSEYTIVPFSETPAMKLGAQVKNRGLNAVTNVKLKINVLNSIGTSVYNATTSAIPSLSAGTTTHLSVPAYTPTATGSYSVSYKVTITESDGNTTNDSVYLSNTLVISDTVYARDDGNLSGSLGIGAGNGGYLGQEFDILTKDSLTSVSFYVTKGYTGRKAGLAIWNMTGGAPDSIIAVTDTMLYPDNAARFYTLPISFGYIILTPGVYTVTAIEFDSTLTVGQTNSIFTNHTTWVNWPTSPFGDWANNEEFGSGFTKTFMIRPNFGNADGIITGVPVKKNHMEAIVYPNPASNELYLHVQANETVDMDARMYDTFGMEVKNLAPELTNSLDKKIDISDLASGVYFIVVHAGQDIAELKTIVVK